MLGNKRLESPLMVQATSLYALLCLSVACSSSTKSSNDEVSTETDTGETDTGLTPDTSTSDSETAGDDSDSTDPTTDGTVGNEIRLIPSSDCIHPEAVDECENGWCRIPAGCFVFGSADYEGNGCRSRYAEDQAEVTLSRDFEIRQTETTQAEWQAEGFELPHPISATPCPECPISWITIYEAMAYCNALSQNAGLPECYDLSDCQGTLAGGCPDEPLMEWGCAVDDADTYVCSGNVHTHDDPYACPGYRLPTTAEWEYAARAGTRTATYIGDLLHEVRATRNWRLGDTIRWRLDTFMGGTS